MYTIIPTRNSEDFLTNLTIVINEKVVSQDKLFDIVINALEDVTKESFDINVDNVFFNTANPLTRYTADIRYSETNPEVIDSIFVSYLRLLQ